MTEESSKNIAVASDSNILFEAPKIEKRSYVPLNLAPNFFNHRRTHRVTINGIVASSEVGTFSAKLSKGDTSATATLLPFSFTTFVRMQKNNGAYACLSPTVFTMMNTADNAY